MINRIVLPLALSIIVLGSEQAAYAQQYNNSARPPANIDLQLSELTARLEASHIEADSQKDLLARRQIEFADRQLKFDIAAVPRYFYTSQGKKYGNPDYGSIVQSLRDAFDSKVAIINEQLDKDRSQMNSFYDKRQADLRQSCDNLKSQISSTTGSVQVTAQGTGMYVRNYINYGGVEAQPHYSVPIVSKPQPELTAVAAKLNSPSQSKVHKQSAGR